jgi:hypothetical protein
MKSKHLLFLSLASAVILMSACKKSAPGGAGCLCNCNPDDLVASVSVYADGLNVPRGLKFGSDGSLYVAEAGIGGANSSVNSACMQVPGPVGPYSGSDTGSRISRIWKGQRITVADKLPSTIDAQGDIAGVSDVAFIGNTLYGLLAGAGCSHGVPAIPNGIVKSSSK